MRDEDGKDPRCLSLQQIEYRRQTHAAARNSAGMRVQVFPVNLNTVGAGRSRGRFATPSPAVTAAHLIASLAVTRGGQLCDLSLAAFAFIVVGAIAA